MQHTVIREFQIEDYDNLISLWQKAELPYKAKGRDSRDKLRKELKNENAIFLVAEIGREIVGSVFATHDGRKDWINRLAVSPDYRRKGIARLLEEEAVKRLEADGIEIIACLIESWNATSMEVFEKLGYTGYTDIIYFTKRKYPDV